MAPRFDSSGSDTSGSDSCRSRPEAARPAPAQDPVELAAQLVMLPAEVVWSMFGRAMAGQVKVLVALTRHATGHAAGGDPGASRSTDNPR